MTEYRSKARRRRRWHWSDRSWLNPRRWLAAPLVAAALGALATLVGVGAQVLGGGFLPWGALALLGTLAGVGAIAWAQSDINYLKARELRERNR